MNFSTTQKGIFLLGVGFFLFLNSLGILGRGFNALFIIASVLMMVKGFMMLNGHEYIAQVIKKIRK